MQNLIVILVVSITATGINLSGIFTAREPTVIQMIASAIYIIFWLLFPMYKGLNRERGFVKFMLSYWLIGLVLSFVGVVGFLRVLSIFSVFIFTGPSYGILMYLSSRYFDTPLLLWSICVPLVLGLIGYFIGTIIGRVEYAGEVE